MRRLAIFAALAMCAAAATAAGPSKCLSWPLVPSDHITSHALAASTAESVTAPTPPLARHAGLSVVVVWTFTGSAFYYRSSGTATVPSADVTDGTASALNPSSLVMRPGTSVSIVTGETGKVAMASWYVLCGS